ncbi:MAG: hypothetical protein ABGX32_01370 [Methylococcales bacterium]|jgi:hypothetical protein
MNNTTTQEISNNSSIEEYISKKEFGASSLCPITDSELNWIFKQREYNGFKEAFVKVTARNYLVHIPTFTACLSEKRGL